jgi:uncharacterized protein
VFTMNLITFGFFTQIAFQMTWSLLADRASYNPSTLARSLRRIRRSPLLSRELWRRLREYNEPGFHPDDRDTTALVEQWRTELFGNEGTLTDRLALQPAEASKRKRVASS